ncbi:MAG TPA: glycosyltransferase family 39 protein [Humisphaera sp.]
MRARLPLVAVLLFAAAAFCAGITWGLPSRAADPFLFGDRRAWTGPEMAALEKLAAGQRSAADPAAPPAADRGADVDANARLRGTLPVVVNPRGDGVDEQLAAAEVVRRYRLFSHQPDEMITFMALRNMSPGRLDLDPRLYQYGGLWVYPVAALLKAGQALRLLDVRPDLSFYLDRPDAFGRFYVAARLYSAFWGVVAAAAVFSIVGRITGSRCVATVAGLAFCCMPVVVNMAHEAKPHVAGAALVLLTVLAAARYVETGRVAHALAAGALAGCALGMVLSSLPVFAVPVLMALLRRQAWGDRFRVAASAVLAGFVAYGASNPYVVVHLLRGAMGQGTGALGSNLANSSAFYSVHRIGEGLLNAARLTGVGAGLAVAVVGAVGTAVLAARAVKVRRSTDVAEIRRRALGLLLAAPAVLTAAQAALVGAGKPGEFARFLLLTDVFLLVEAVVLLDLLAKRCARTAAPGGASSRITIAAGACLVAATAFAGWPYVAGFVRDTDPRHTSRMVAAAELKAMLPPDPPLPPQALERMAAAAARFDPVAAAIAHAQHGVIVGSRPRPRLLLRGSEPAPFRAPPMDLWRWDVVAVPRDATVDERPGDVWVEVDEGRTPISWADKRIVLRRGRER